MNIQMLNLDKIIPYPNNPKLHPEVQIKKIANSIQEFGFKVPILVDKEYNIIAGHGRYLAARRLGLKEVPVIIASDLTPAQVKAFRIADNRITLESEWELEALALELENLIKEDYDLSLTMLNEKEIDYFLTSFSMKQVDNSSPSEDFNSEELWETMTEYASEDKTPYRKIIINFPNEQAIKKFKEVTGLEFSDKTQSIWFPPKERLERKEYRYELFETEDEVSNEESK